ncbi:SRPBCC family protein [Natronomonas gomsonensis]|uniref:SRPBCC family protein n=1 Tax=Natronomonas gomsonensis TaxID=1046043 RepID=UPI0015C04AA1|nr:SRPBCC family protein [Natronomonas gomsonensis]
MDLERTPDGRRWVVGRDIDADPAAVWSVLCDTARWPEWGVSITDVEASERHIQTGTTGRVRIRGVGAWIPFEVTAVDDATRRWSWDVARIPATGHRVEERASGCRVEFEIPLAAVGYAPVCRAACRSIAALTEQ